MDQAVASHVNRCRVDGCSCRVYFKSFDTWAKRLPLSDSGVHAEETWLWHEFCGSQPQFLQWTCVACEGSPHASSKYRQRKMSTKPEIIKLGNLLEHHNSPCHKKAVAQAFNLSVAETQTEYSAPSTTVFKELVLAFQKGQTPTGGFDLRSCHITFEKAVKMLWCCGEGLGDIRREAIASADCLNIMRDERHSRMHVRYRCGSEAKAAKSGYFGQSRDHPSDAIGLTEATTDIFRSVCTKFANPPKGASVEETFDKPAFNHACQLLEAVSVDSAENEVVSVRDMASWGFDGKPPQYPNCIWILRDGVHSGRRVLSRLWKADEVMDNCFGFFCHWSESPAQLIQWSDDNRRIYAGCSAESDCKAVSTKFGHMRAAKHRIETHVSPLSRCCLDPDAVMGFAQKLSILKRGQSQGKSMSTFLITINGELWLLAAMMTDGAVEAMELLRFLDTENAPVADLCEKVTAFLDHITWMFFQGGVFKVKGHTSFIIQWYQSRTHHFVVNGTGRAFGGMPFSQDQLNNALKHLQSWVHLSRHTLEAEFPSFSIINALTAFRLPKNANARVDLAMTDEVTVRLQRLANAFKQPTLIAEYRRHWPTALRCYAESSFLCCYYDAWRKSMELIGGNSNGLGFVVCRGDTFAPITSGVEQSFAKVDAALGKNRLNANSTSESLMVALLVQKFTEADLDDLANRAQQTWRLAFQKHSRLSLAPRRDKGVLRSLQSSAGSSVEDAAPTERKFLKRLRADVSRQATTGASSILSTHAAELWEDTHTKELEFQKQKRQKRLVEALPPQPCI